MKELSPTHFFGAYKILTLKLNSKFPVLGSTSPPPHFFKTLAIF